MKNTPKPAYNKHLPPPAQSKPATSKAFTLAEVLTTLMVIGVVAAITIPALTNSITEMTLNKQKTVFNNKFLEGLKLMRVDDKLNEKYATTGEFVEVMKKYFKIIQVCNNTNLENCFVSTFTSKENNVNGEEEIATINLTSGMTASDFSINTRLKSDVVGITFSDGVKMLIAINPNCVGIESGNTTGVPTKCFYYAADVNGAKSPNTVSKDIVSNIGFVDVLGFEIAPVGMLSSDETGYRDATQETGDNAGMYADDYWLSAKYYCEETLKDVDGGGWRLPTATELANIAHAIYKNLDCETYHSGVDILYFNCKELPGNSTLWHQLNGTGNSFCLWEDEKFGIYQGSDWAWHRCFYSGAYNNYSTDRHNNSKRNIKSQKTICVR